jgi:hypothetical protein
VSFLEQSISLLFCLFFWRVAVSVFVPKSPMVEFASHMGLMISQVHLICSKALSGPSQDWLAIV